MNDADMRLVTGRFKRSADDPNDSRLNYIREFGGTLDSSSVYSYDTYFNRRTNFDSSHLWHVHLSILRKYSNDQAAMKAILSVVRGETVEQWRAGGGTPTSDTSPPTNLDDDMPLIHEQVVPGKGATTPIRPPWGRPGWSKVLVSFATDFADGVGGVKLRVVAHSAVAGKSKSADVVLGKAAGGETKDAFEVEACDRIVVTRVDNGTGIDPQNAPVAVLVYGS